MPQARCHYGGLIRGQPLVEEIRRLASASSWHSRGATLLASSAVPSSHLEASDTRERRGPHTAVCCGNRTWSECAGILVAMSAGC